MIFVRHSHGGMGIIEGITSKCLGMRYSHLVLGGWVLLLAVASSPLSAQFLTDTLPMHKNEVIPSRNSYYVEAGSYSTRREADPPNYTRDLSKTGIPAFAKVDWLTAGLDYRVRFEYRNNDIRRPESFSSDFPFLLRGRAYLGVKEIFDPLRMVVEFEDATRVNGNYPLDNRDVNRFEMIQGYAELFSDRLLNDDKLGNKRPVYIRGGRMAFEFADRRLIGLNQWRNTTNNFVGLRATVGQDKNDWQVDVLALKPIERIIDQFDEAERDRYFWALIGHHRQFSRIVTIEPYYLALRQEPSKLNNGRYRQIHSPGLRLYGYVSNTGLNYDVSGTYQFGKEGDQIHSAYAITAELGYTVTRSSWKPRVSLFYGYVSGDKDPDDELNNRFERFFGFGRPWSSDDYIIPENIVTPKLRVEFEPVKGVKVDGGYSFYWLASETDRFNNLLAGDSFNRDPSGNSGTFLGHGLDSRVRFKPVKFIDANLGYTYYTIGEYVHNRQLAANGESADYSNFIYIELSFNVFDVFSPPGN